jgi:sugar (pentulose or hexulose) kinase
VTATPSWFRDTQPAGQRVQTAGTPFDVMTAQVESIPAGAHGLIFLPYMAGERAPLWNSNARGVFFGLSYKTDRCDILRAIMEGCAFAIYHNLKIAERSGVTVSEWIGVGGATRSAAWCQIKADVTGKPFVLARRRGGGEGGHALGLYAISLAIRQCDDIALRIEEILTPGFRAFANAGHVRGSVWYLPGLSNKPGRLDRLAEVVE